MTAPLGLLGELTISIFVRGVIARETASARKQNPSDGSVITVTGVAPVNRTMSGYVTQYGAGIRTSSPFSSSAQNALKSACLPPAVTIHSGTVYDEPNCAACHLQIASRSGPIPAVGVYFVRPSCNARIAARWMCSGVGKSGSPG